MEKKGELTTKQLITIIILIVSFVVILFLILRLDLGGTTKKEICHNSVITRGSSVLPTESIPLKCDRSYICITADNTCESMTNPIKKKVENQEEVYEVLAEELADCWWMFGEGKIDYVGKDMVGKVYCSICSQIAFDNSLEDIFPEGEIDKEAVYEYMGANDYSEDETYLNYLYDTNDLEELKTELVSQNIEFGPMDMDQQYYAMMSITSDVSVVGWAVRVAGVAVGAIFLLPITSPIGSISFIAFTTSGVVGGGAGAFIGGVVRGESGNDYLPPSIVRANSPEFEGLNCKSITTLS